MPVSQLEDELMLAIGLWPAAYERLLARFI